MKSNQTHNDSLGELLSEYYSGAVSDQKKSEIEELANSDAFLKEAMEGYNEFPEAINSIPDFSVKKPFFSKWTVAISILGLILIGGIILSYYKSDLNQQTAIAVTETKAETTIPETEKIEPILLMDNKVEEKSIPKEIQKKAKKEKKTPKANPIKKEIVREQIELPKIELDSKQFQEKIDYTVKKAKTKAIGYFGFLAVDYSLIYSNTIKTEPQFSGTDASRANLKEKSTILDNGLTRNIYTYKEFLKQTCFFMRERNFSLAIKNLKTILKEFPRDANAEFYLGYCYYEIGNYEKAIPYFELAMSNAFDFFMEDSQWFKANSLENSGKLKEAQQLYNQIKEKGGYYSSRIR